MRAGIIVEVTSEDRDHLELIVGDRNTPQKHAARARVILATAEGCGTLEIVRRSGLSKPVRDIAWKAQLRLCARYRKLALARKPANVVTTAIARELAGFVWAIARQVSPIQ